MTLSINGTFDLITVSSEELDDFISSPGSYVDVVVTGYYNSTTDSTSKTYTSTSPITGSTDVSTSAGVEKINPSFFGGTAFEAGVYYFTVTLTSEAGIEVDEGCIFVDDGIACLVDDYRIGDATINDKILAGIDYTLLLNSQQCACKCLQLIELYNSLYKKLTTNSCQGC